MERTSGPAHLDAGGLPGLLVSHTFLHSAMVWGFADNLLIIQVGLGRTGLQTSEKCHRHRDEA